MSNSVWLYRRQPTRLPRPWDSPGKNTGVGCHFLLQCMKGKSESEVAQSGLTLSDPMDCSLPGSSIHGFSRQEYWSGVPLLLVSIKACYLPIMPSYISLIIGNPEHSFLVYWLSFFFFCGLFIHILCLVFAWIYGSSSEKAMAPNSSTLAWKIPWTEEPGRLQSLVSLKVGDD